MGMYDIEKKKDWEIIQCGFRDNKLITIKKLDKRTTW